MGARGAEGAGGLRGQNLTAAPINDPPCIPHGQTPSRPVLAGFAVTALKNILINKTAPHPMRGDKTGASVYL